MFTTSTSSASRGSAHSLPFASGLLLAVFSFASLSFPTLSDAFIVGSNYDVMLNAFVHAPDGEMGMEGHFSTMSVMDGAPDVLPMNFPIPGDLTGPDLETIEKFALDGDPDYGPSKIFIYSPNGGPVVANELLEGDFGRVTMSISKLQLADLDRDNGETISPEVYLYDSLGERRLSTEPIYVTGDGSALEPWRVITSIQSEEFGEDTERVEFVFNVVPEPSSWLLALVGIAGLIRRRR